MKKLKIIVPILLLALLQIYSFVHIPKDAPVSIYSDGTEVQLSKEHSAEVVSVINLHPFWMPGGGYWCDCASDIRITIGDDSFAFAGSHCHHPSKWLTLRLPEWEAAKIYYIAETYGL